MHRVLPRLTGSFPTRLLACLLIATACAMSGAQADTLRLSSYEQAPRFFLAVSKSQQSLYVLQRKSPLQTLQEFSCSTGDKPGNKQSEGDERTPEGVYFLEDIRSTGLDYSLYGDLAYTLNYPNPVDRIQGKTGYGIWMHGRGKELVPRDTKGCIALESRHIRNLSDEIRLHLTPVLIGAKTELAVENASIAETASTLSQKVADWVEAWERKSKEYFSFYDAEKYTLASASSFRAFKEQKERLFSAYPWIRVYLDEIRVLPGPDYWVTYFGQYFRSPSYVSEGIKRIYWQRGEKGWRIVGEEWRNKRLGLEQGYIAEAAERIEAWLGSWRDAWKSADLERYLEFYRPGARQQGRDGLRAIAAFKQRLWDEEEPERIEFEGISVDLHRQGFEVSFLQRYQGARGYSDYGRKTLILVPAADGFRIANEQWTAMTPS